MRPAVSSSPKAIAALMVAARRTSFIGFLASKYIAGKSVGERGKVKSIVIPLRKWGVHLHHWLYSVFLMSLSFTTGIHFLTPEVTYGLLSGLVFQGVYCYGDWHIILVSRHWKAKSLDDTIEPDENVEIVGSERLTLIVKRKGS